MPRLAQSPPPPALAAARRRRARREAGYSLLEILIVLAIIALIAALVGPRLFAQLDRSKTTAARVQAKALESALETMRLDIGRYPTVSEGLPLLSTAGEGVANWSGPYLAGGLPKDPWGRDYLYAAPVGEGPAEPKVTSLGSDGKPGGTGSAADVTG